MRSTGYGALYSMEMPNAKLVKQGLQNFAAGVPKIGRQTMFKLAQRISAHYAYTRTNPPVHGKYVRTFAMKKSRKILKEQFGYVFVMDPEHPKKGKYASYVVGDMRENSQSIIQKGWWVPLRQVVLAETAKLPAEIRQQLGELIAEETSKANRL